jgi:hypothetical protein
MLETFVHSVGRKGNATQRFWASSWSDIKNRRNTPTPKKTRSFIDLQNRNNIRLDCQGNDVAID